MNPNAIPVFVINLDSSQERYVHAEHQLVELGVQPSRFAGINGKYLNPDEIDRCYDKACNNRHFRRSLSLGEIGCYLSHRAVWQQIVAQNIAQAIVLEDDVEVDPQLPLAIQQICQLSGYCRISLFFRNC